MIFHIYAAVSVILIILFILNNRSKKEGYLFLIGAFIVFFILAFRGPYIGGDTDDYCGYFNGKGGSYGTLDIYNGFEYGFYYFCKLLSLISRDDFFFLFITSAITLVPFLYLVKRDTKGNKILPLCLYMMCWRILQTTQTAIRQNLSVACLMIAFIILTSDVKNKKYKYILMSIFVFYGCISHTSSLVALPLLIGAFMIPFTKKTAFITVISSLVISLLFKNLFSNVFDVFFSFMRGVDMASHMLDTYYGNDDYALTNEVSFNRLGPSTLLVCILIYLSNKKDIKSPYFNFLVVGASLFNLGSVFPMISRTVYALLFFGIIFCPSDIKSGLFLRLRTIIIVLLFFFVRNQIVYASYGNSSQDLPYTFIWEKNDIRTLK